MSRVAIVRDSDGVVVNIAEVDFRTGPPIWSPPEDHTALTLTDTTPVNPGDIWDGSVFIPRTPSQEEIDERGRQDRFRELDEKLRARTMSLPELQEIVAKMRGLE